MMLDQVRTSMDIDNYCNTIIADEGFFPNITRLMLRDIVVYCVKENMCDYAKLKEIANADLETIIETLQKHIDTEKGINSLRDHPAAENILGVLRHYVIKKDEL